MVHALEEIRRVLSPVGSLLDLRPLADRWPVEVVRDDGPLEIGRLTDLPIGLGDDLAANTALEEAARLGWFKLKSEITFPLYTYWDNPDEMIRYVSERWADFVQLGDNIQKATRTAWAAAGTNRRVRLRLKMLLAHLQKQ
jgi:hypothetical protein